MDEEKMETPAPRTPAQKRLNTKQMAAFLNQTVFDFLRKELQDEVEDAEKQLEDRDDLDKAAKLVCLTTIDDNNAKLATLTAKKDVMDESMMEEYDTVDKIQTLELQLVGMLRLSMQYSYGLDIVSVNLARSVAEKTARAFAVRFEPKSSSPSHALTDDDMKQLEIAFTQTDYIGDASIEFNDYVLKCWEKYCKNPSVFKAPCVAVVQSSGFGKSRMLYELARMSLGEKSKMKVLYTCDRKHESTGYPEATKMLRSWLFNATSTAALIAAQLENIYYHALVNWKDVQTEWLNLFTSTEADVDVHKKLSMAIETEMKAHVTKKWSKKVVVLVIDEARSLLTESKSGDINHFRMLRRALVSANNRIQKFAKASESNLRGGIFGVLVDTNSKVSDLTPPLSQDPSSRNMLGATVLASFPPFVLTHTMDILWQEHYINNHSGDGVVINEEMQDDFVMKEEDEEMEDENASGGGEVATDKEKVLEASRATYKAEQKKLMATVAAYKAAVTGDQTVAWEAILAMGRPLWGSTLTKLAEERGLLTKNQDDVINLAANKLLLGYPPGQDSYTEKTMYGVASMLCRLGVRPYSTSALASRAIADFMAILAYVDYEKEGYVSSYASDPVLTLGAIKVWYAQKDVLANYILPQLKKLILNEALDTGGVGEIVARIVMLLAMDSCAKEENAVGEFVSVSKFLRILGAFAPEIIDSEMNVSVSKTKASVSKMKASVSKTKASVSGMQVIVKGMNYAKQDVVNAYHNWLSFWDNWQMGFTHFVQMNVEPDENTLWYLLGRRAAGIFPRGHQGADLFIPIFRTKSIYDSILPREEVSLVLVQVKNRSGKDSGFSRSATTKLSPLFVFGEENTLQRKTNHEVIRIYMNVQEENNNYRRFIYTDNANGSDGFTLCYRSIGSEAFPFISNEVATKLASLASPMWNPMTLVEGDLQHRSEMEKFTAAKMSEVMPDEKLKKIASGALANPLVAKPFKAVLPDEKLKKMALTDPLVTKPCEAGFTDNKNLRGKSERKSDDGNSSGKRSQKRSRSRKTPRLNH